MSALEISQAQASTNAASVPDGDRRPTDAAPPEDAHREARLFRLRRAVADGAYRVDTSRIAAKLLKER